MGYFQLLRELDAEAGRQAEAAASAAAQVAGDVDDLLRLAWSHTDEPSYLATLYERASADDDALALELSRVEAALRNSPEEARALFDQGVRASAPLLVSKLQTDAKQSVLRLLLGAYPTFDAPCEELRELAQTDDPFAAWGQLVLSHSRFDEDRAMVLELLEAGRVAPGAEGIIRTHLIGRGDDSQDDWIVENLRRFADALQDETEAAVRNETPRHLRREDESPVVAFIEAAKTRQLADAVEPLCTLLHSFDALEALDALGAIGDESALEPVGRYRAMLAGRPDLTLPFRLAAENALSALGEPQPLDSAREAFQTLYPKRYGYPKLDDCIVHWRRGAEAFVDRGDDQDLKVAAQFATAPYAILREVGAIAWAKLHGEELELAYWDGTRARHALETAGPEALFEALEDPTGVYRHNAAVLLVEQDDASLRERGARWIRDTLESRHNFFADGVGQLPVDVKAMLQSLQKSPHADVEAVLDGTTSRWIEAFVLDGEELEKPEPPPAPVDESLGEVRVTELGSAPFLYGKHVNGLASSPDASRLAVVGSELGRVDDAAGEQQAVLDLRWNWGYDVAFSPDGAAIAVGFHGGHVELFSVEDGSRLERDFEGHRGVPDGVKRIAFSPDGTSLVTVGQDARVILWDVQTGEQRWMYQAAQGSYEAVVWTPGGDQIIASHVKTTGGEENFLTVHDPATEQVRRHDLKHSVWALAFSPDAELLAMGGEANEVLICDPDDFGVRRELELGATTRLSFSRDGEWLYGCSEHGVVKRWKVGEDEPEGETLLEEAGPLWALDIASDGVVRCVGTRGVVHTFVDGELQETEASNAHTKQVGVVDGTTDDLLTGDWGGALVRWPSDGSEPSVLFEGSGRINAVARYDDGRLAIAAAKGLFVRHPDGSVDERFAETSVDVVAVSRDGRQLAFDRNNVLRIVTDDGEVDVVAGSDRISSVTAVDGGWLVGTKAGEVSFIRGDERVWTITAHGADRLERGTGHKDLCDLRIVDGGFVTAGNDNTVRVFAWDGGSTMPELTLRIHTYLGIFNTLAIAPSEEFGVMPNSGGLQIYSFDGARLASIGSREHFGGNQLTAASFIDEHSLAVGTNTNRIFRVEFDGGRNE